MMLECQYQKSFNREKEKYYVKESTWQRQVWSSEGNEKK